MHWSLGFGFLGLWMLATPGAAQTLVDPPCGSVIREGETATFTEDLTCTGSTITLIGGTLNMGGHTLECGDFGRGIDVYGTDSRLFNGTVTGCSFGVWIRPFFGNGNHLIYKINSSGNFNGFSMSTNNTTLRLVTANRNISSGVIIGAEDSNVMGAKVIRSTAMQNGECGVKIGINAEGTKLQRNELHQNDDQGLCDFGSGSEAIGNRADGNNIHGFQYGGPNAVSEGGRYRANRAAGNRFDGFSVVGSGGMFLLNRAIDNDQNGFFVAVEANRNIIRLNRAFDNGDSQTTLDILDEAGNCADNMYSFNRFDTATECVR